MSRVDIHFYRMPLYGLLTRLTHKRACAAGFIDFMNFFLLTTIQIKIKILKNICLCLAAVELMWSGKINFFKHLSPVPNI